MTSRKSNRDVIGFGIWMTPSFVTSPITSQIDADSFDNLPIERAADVLEGLAILQSLRTGVVSAVLLPPLALLQGGRWDPVLGCVVLTALMWLPSYGLTLAFTRLWLVRRGRHGRVDRRVPRGMVMVVRAAPLFALVPSLLVGLSELA